MTASPGLRAKPQDDDVPKLLAKVRRQTNKLAKPLSAEDMMLQSMEDASPVKWHLAHTTWFFEEFILREFVTDYQSPDDRFAFLFNSYYAQAGPRHQRDKRGLISRPGVEEVLSYREYVEDALFTLLQTDTGNIEKVLRLTELGCHHEMQHQELLVTDLLHGLSYNALLPAYQSPQPTPIRPQTDLDYQHFDGGLIETGHHGDGFAFDCEEPRHKTYVAPYELANRAVTNREWIEFIDDGGYDKEPLWLSEGWALCQKEKWAHPLYWWKQDDEWWSFTLCGAQPVKLDAPVVHVSYYEADAFACWAEARLPTEAEWENAAVDQSISGNFLEDGAFRPLPGTSLWGDVWVWTQSPFTPYPGFRAPEGAIGEYNGKFMVNQMVLRGGSCVTPRAQMRATYRTFFYPHQRWQMLGLRLARDVG